MKELRKAQGPLEVASGEVMHVELPKMNALWLEAVEGGGGKRERETCVAWEEFHKMLNFLLITTLVEVHR